MSGAEQVPDIVGDAGVRRAVGVPGLLGPQGLHRRGKISLQFREGRCNESGSVGAQLGEGAFNGHSCHAGAVEEREERQRPPGAILRWRRAGAPRRGREGMPVTGGDR